MSDITADAYFAIVPEYLLTASSNAVKLFAILNRYANDRTNEAHPSRATLATRMGFSRTQSVDPIIAELVELGAIDVEPRHSPDGDRTSNAYHLHMITASSNVRSTAPGRPRKRTTGSTPDRTVTRAIGTKEKTVGEQHTEQPSTDALVPIEDVSDIAKVIAEFRSARFALGDTNASVRVTARWHESAKQLLKVAPLEQLLAGIAFALDPAAEDRWWCDNTTTLVRFEQQWPRIRPRIPSVEPQPDPDDWVRAMCLTVGAAPWEFEGGAEWLRREIFENAQRMGWIPPEGAHP